MPAPKTEKRLGRNLGFLAVFAIGTGTMIGAGIFVLPGIASEHAGPAAALSFLVGGLISLATAISMAELATGMPKAGGTYYFISRAMGPYFGTIIGIGAWMALVFKGSFALVGLAEYFKQLVPIPILVVAIAAGLILLWLNYRGAESSGKLQNFIVLGLFIILLGYILWGGFVADSQNLDPFMPYGVRSVFATTGIIFVSFLGITQLAALSEEVKEPSKNLPRAFIASVSAVTLLYLGVMLVTNGLMPLQELIQINTPLVEGGRILAGNVGRVAIILAGFFATVSTANAAIISSSRFPFAMSRDKLVPDWFVDIHDRFSTPYKSVLVTGGIMILLLIFFNVEELARLGSTFNVMIFVLVNIAVIILRNTEQEWYQPTFNDPLYPVTQIVGIGASLMLVPQLGTASVIFALVAIALGSIWYFTYGREKAHPRYSMFDILERPEIPTAPEEIEKRVLVPVNDPEYESDILHLAATLGDTVVGMNVIQVPQQTSLAAGKKDYEKHEEKRHQILEEQFRQSSAEHPGKNYRFLLVFDHSVPGAITEQANNEEADLIVMGWQSEDRQKKLVGSLTDTLLRKSPHNVAVLKGHFPKNMEKITVPYGGGINADYALYLAKRLAVASNADVEIFRVVNPDLTDEKKESIKEELEQLTDIKSPNYEGDIYYTIRERYSVSDALLDVTRETDLLLLGDSNERVKRAFLGRVPIRVARHSEGPVLIVRRYSPLSLAGIRNLLSRTRSKREPENTKQIS